MADLTKTYIKKDHVKERVVEDNIVIYDELEAEIVGFNETGSCMWEAIVPENTLSDIINKISSEFFIPKTTAEKDVIDFMRQLLTLGLVEDYSGTSKYEKLSEVYKQIPETICSGCAQCCKTAVIYSLEFENIKRYVEKEFTPERIEQLKAGVGLNIATQIKQRQLMRQEKIEEMPSLEVCVFLDQKKKQCLIYRQRPFACRVFGIEKKSDCCSQEICFKSGIPMAGAWMKTGALRERLEQLADYYYFPTGGVYFNKAEINSWFHYGNQLVLPKE